MLSGKNIKAVVVLLFVIAVAVANGVPTTSNDDTKIHLCGIPPNSNAHSPSVLAPPHRGTGLEKNQIIESSDDYLATIAEELLKPPACFINSPVANTHVSSLPPVPKALFMALVGFLCVSLVKDRKVWMAAFIALLWLGQTGVTTLPRLALHLAGKRQIKQTSSNVTYAHRLLELDRPRSDIEGTQYIGLLHYLAGIPSAKRNTILDSLRRMPSGRFSMLVLRRASCVVRDAFPRLQALNSHIFQPTQNRRDGLRHKVRNTKSCPERSRGDDIRNTHKSPKHAIVSLLPKLSPQNTRLAKIAEQPICFSPAFIFSLLARSPPKGL